jgi:hypothetical protein
MPAFAVRLRIALLWLNLLTVTGCLARFWWVCANPDERILSLSNWVAPERWLAFGLMLHSIAICLLVMNLVICMRLRGRPDIGIPSNSVPTSS